MMVKEIEVTVKRNIYGYFENYCNNCPHMENEIVGFENLNKIDQKALYKCKNSELCSRLYRYLKGNGANE